MNNKIKIVSMILLGLVLTGAGCARTPSEYAARKAAEKLLEGNAGGNVNLDIQDKSVKYKANGVEMVAGGDVKLPSGFPTDVYTNIGKFVSASSFTANQGFQVSIETSKSTAEAYQFYQDKLKADGWSITGTMSFGELSTVTAENDTRIVTVMVSRGDTTATLITITVSKK